MTLLVGDRVKHPTLHEQWGPGEVLAVAPDGKMTVVFALGGQKTLKGITLQRLEGVDGADPVLDRRKSLAKGKGKGKGGGKVRPRVFSTLREVFLRMFPGGFSDPAYLAEERDPKLSAHQAFGETLGEGELENLLQEKAFSEISKRALAVVNAANLGIPNEIVSLKDGLAGKREHELFARSLGALLYGSGEYRTRFEPFVDVLEQLGANKWPLATYFPFVAFPQDHMFFKPEVTKRAAEACSFELNYRVELNWWTYESLLRFTASLRELIIDLEPRDNIDMQSFIFCIGERV
jgi:hypothetical protein